MLFVIFFKEAIEMQRNVLRTDATASVFYKYVGSYKNMILTTHNCLIKAETSYVCY